MKCYDKDGRKCDKPKKDIDNKNYFRTADDFYRYLKHQLGMDEDITFVGEILDENNISIDMDDIEDMYSKPSFDW